ncbi:hypothetical protein Fcan01_21033, partial [Folsomia candida]
KESIIGPIFLFVIPKFQKRELPPGKKIANFLFNQSPSQQQASTYLGPKFMSSSSLARTTLSQETTTGHICILPSAVFPSFSIGDKEEEVYRRTKGWQASRDLNQPGAKKCSSFSSRRYGVTQAKSAAGISQLAAATKQQPAGPSVHPS